MVVVRRVIAKGPNTATVARRRDGKILPFQEGAMTALTVFNHVFDDVHLTTLIYRGRPCWVARDVGAALGYTERGKEFAKRIQDEWAEEMLEGHDFIILRGQELQDFKALTRLTRLGVQSTPSQTEPGGELPPSRAPTLILLFESGLWMALAKTRRDAGKRLRRFLVDNVLPQIARDGQYSPGREVTPEGQLVEREDAQAAERDHLAAEERRLAVEREKLEVEKRKLAAEALWRLCDVLKDATYLKDDVKKSLAVAAAEEASGRSLAGFLPPADASFQWESPTQIAERLRVTVQRVGKAITTLGLRGVEGMSRAIVNKASHSDRTVTTYLYSPEAVARIEEYLLGADRVTLAHP